MQRSPYIACPPWSDATLALYRLRHTLFKCNASPLCRLCPPCSNATLALYRLPTLVRCSTRPISPATLVRCNARLYRQRHTLFKCNADPPTHLQQLVQMQRQSLVLTPPTLTKCNTRPSTSTPTPCSNATLTMPRCNVRTGQMQRSAWPNATVTLVKCNGKPRLRI